MTPMACMGMTTLRWRLGVVVAVCASCLHAAPDRVLIDGHGKSPGGPDTEGPGRVKWLAGAIAGSTMCSWAGSKRGFVISKCQSTHAPSLSVRIASPSNEPDWPKCWSANDGWLVELAGPRFEEGEHSLPPTEDQLDGPSATDFVLMRCALGARCA